MIIIGQDIMHIVKVIKLLQKFIDNVQKYLLQLLLAFFDSAVQEVLKR